MPVVRTQRALRQITAKFVWRLGFLTEDIVAAVNSRSAPLHWSNCSSWCSSNQLQLSFELKCSRGMNSWTLNKFISCEYCNCIHELYCASKIVDCNSTPRPSVMFSISIIWMTALGCANVSVTDSTVFCLLVFCLLLNYFSAVNGYRKDPWGGPEVFGTNIFWIKNVKSKILYLEYR
jgi:hypothetical protein